MSHTKPPYILQELSDITEHIKYPLRSIQRVKYTCFDVSKSLIAFGATSGGIYVFNRSPCDFLQLIPNKDGAITRLAISTAEKHIAFANGRGIISVTECDQALNGGPGLLVSREHQGNEVTAMVWSGNALFAGDDVGKISVLQLQGFIAKTMFQSSSQTIMSLDSRICQLDLKDCMLLISTFTRSYICDTSQEQYRQIGQKTRDGEFGACFVTQEKPIENSAIQNTVQDFAEVKKYNIVEDDTRFAVGKELESTLIYCARPSSRLWEVSIDGSVRRTLQFKQVLAKQPMRFVSQESYNNENVCIESAASEIVSEGQSVNFSKVYHVNSAIFSYRKDALYFLDVQDVDKTIWFDCCKDIMDCKVYCDYLYIWLGNGCLINMRLMKIDKFLVKCYIDEKYVLCTEMCALYSNYLVSNDLSTKLHILAGLRDKLQNNGLLKAIENVLEKFDSLKTNDATQMKSGIYVVDNTYNAQSMMEEDSKHDDSKFRKSSPEALQTLKDFSSTVTDKLASSKNILKEKWVDFEGKMKNLSSEKQIVQDIALPKMASIEEQSSEQNIVVEYDNDIIYKESSQKTIDIDNNSSQKDKICKSLYQYFRLSLVGKETERSNLISIIESYACDISQICELMLLLKKYCVSIGALEESKFVPNNIFLTYISISPQKGSLLDSIINDDVLYKYFVNSCISVNVKTENLSNISCECGFPLPYNRGNQQPAFSDIIDEFIEKQWSNHTRDQCYDVCKKMPYLWRKILYLRRNEDLLNVLRLLLQMLDESLLHSFLPQFTLDTWDRAIQLYATLHANICLNCNRKFDNISVKETLSWDNIGGLIIKSVGGKNAIKVIEKHAMLIDSGQLTMKFYHTCLLVSLYEKYDNTITSQFTDALYSSYDFEDSRVEICNLLRSTIDGQIKNTALPLIVAAKTVHWGLSPLMEKLPQNDSDLSEKRTYKIKDITIHDVVENLLEICNGVTDCVLCGLPLQNEVLIKDGGLWVFKCGHTFHGSCLDLSKLKLCPSCVLKI